LKIIVWLLIRMLRRKELNAIALDYSRNTLSKQIFNQYQGIVQCGLFKGLLVGDLGFWDGGGDAGAKILGIYEQQVLDTFSKMNRFRTLVNLGAADGYYGFGLIFAKKCENVIFFETSHESRLEIEKMNKNYDFPIEIHGEATAEIMSSIIENLPMEDVVFLVDIEGGEFDIFDNTLIDRLNGSTVILEIHDFLNSNFNKSELERKFSEKFSIEKIYNNARKFPPIDSIQNLHDNQRWLLASEGRVKAMEWWILTNRNVSGNGK